MIYPQPNLGGASGGAASRRAAARHCSAGPSSQNSGGVKRGVKKQLVQWKTKNVKEGIVIVDEEQLTKLIKKEPIEKFYNLDPEPFATGMFATVRRAVSKATGVIYAAKFSSRARYGDDCSREIHHEIALLSLCSPSQRIVRLHDVFETKAEIIILMEFAPGGDLQTIIDDNLVPFEADVVNFVRQLVEGLAYLHERKIAHLDIKPQNLVMMGDFPNSDIKLCDFEISRVILEGTEIREILGTPDYVAPEILHYEPITLAADMWSLGVTSYVLLTGFSPFGGETDQETFSNISRAQLDFPEELFEDVSKEAQDFMKKLLARDPKDRPKAKDLLRHPWLSRTPQPSKPTVTEASRTNMSQKNLRKYLSKSREALFERVVQQQQVQRRANDLRKTTLLSQSNKTRLCESHMSLVSKSREENQWSMSPSFSRSREKLYGLRSLSKSHEGLDLLKMSGQVEKGATKAYARATTADLSMLPLLRLQEMSLEEGTLSNYSLDDGENVTKDSEVVKEDVEGSSTVLDDVKEIDEGSKVETQLSPIFLIGCVVQNPVPDVPENVANESILGGKRIHDFSSESEIERKLKDLDENSKNHELDFSVSKDEMHSLESPTVVSVVHKLVNKENEVPSSELESPKFVARLMSLEESRVDNTVSKTDDVTEKDCQTTQVQKSDEDEPKFSVAQLISAYNRHQDIVTKSSLEVTMTASDRDQKLPPIIVEDPQTKFPTGPTALRLFIPNIDIEPSRRKKNRTKSYRSLSRSSTQDSIKNEDYKRDIPPVEDNKVAGSVCNFILASPGSLVSQKVGKMSSYMRSASLSSEASGTSGCYTSESSGSLSWEEAGTLSFTGKDETQKVSQKVKKEAGDPWKKLCNGSYTRAMEKFGGKEEEQKVKPVRKCSLGMMTVNVEVEEKVRRKSTSTMKN